jgi:hypothetical protein
MKTRNCCFCRSEIPYPYGNDPWPLRCGGVCCTQCDNTFVSQARLITSDLHKIETDDQIRPLIIAQWKNLEQQIRERRKPPLAQRA